MKLVIFGSRTITDMRCVVSAVDAAGILPNVAEIVSGAAKGVEPWQSNTPKRILFPAKSFRRTGKNTAASLEPCGMKKWRDMPTTEWRYGMGKAGERNI